MNCMIMLDVRLPFCLMWLGKSTFMMRTNFPNYYLNACLCLCIYIYNII